MALFPREMIKSYVFRLVSFRGNPDKTDYYGNTALHIAAAKGHMQCVDFLVKFGVNLYAKDIERHNAKVMYTYL